MAVLAPSVVRQRIAAGIDGISTAWTESAHIPERFGVAPNTVAHQRFSVAAGEIRPETLDRHSTTDGAQVNQQFTVRIGWKVKSKAQVSSYDAADVATQTALLAALAISQTDLHLWLARRLAPVVQADGERLTLGFVLNTTYRMALA